MQQHNLSHATNALDKSTQLMSTTSAINDPSTAIALHRPGQTFSQVANAWLLSEPVTFPNPTPQYWLTVVNILQKMLGIAKSLCCSLHLCGVICGHG